MTTILVWTMMYFLHTPVGDRVVVIDSATKAACEQNGARMTAVRPNGASSSYVCVQRFVNAPTHGTAYDATAVLP